MQDNRRDNPERGLQDNQNNTRRFFPGSQNNDTQQAQKNRPLQENKGVGDISERDQQEGNMRNGTLGGNFGEDVGGQDYNDHSGPPY